MMFKMLVPVAVLAAGLSVAPVRANSLLQPGGAALKQAGTAAVQSKISSAKASAMESATSRMTTWGSGAGGQTSIESVTAKAATVRSALPAARSPVVRPAPAKVSSARPASVVKRTATSAKTVSKAPVKVAAKSTAKSASRSKAGRGDVTGSIGRNETCKIEMVDLFDRKGNYAKTEKMRVCR